MVGALGLKIHVPLQVIGEKADPDFQGDQFSGEREVGFFRIVEETPGR